MNKILLLIEIPKEEYDVIKKSGNSSFANIAEKECMMHCIKNGIIVPRGLGDLLIIASRYRQIVEVYRNYDYPEYLEIELAKLFDEWGIKHGNN